MHNNIDAKVEAAADAGTLAMRIQKWGGAASFLLAAAFIVAPWIYLVGNLRDPLGPITYSLADFLYGPVWGASLVTAVHALRERIGARAPRRMSLALLAALLAAGTMVLVATIRASNRSYHLMHPELHLESSSAVLTVWTTLVQGVTGAGWHFLGWTLALVGWAGWTTQSFPRVLNILYLSGAAASLFVYAFPEIEGTAAAFGVIWAAWQGIILWRSRPGKTQAPIETTS